MSGKPQEVEIFGKAYRFRGGNPELLKKCADYLNAKLNEVNQNPKRIDIHTIFSVVSMNITEEYLKTLEKVKKIEQDLENLNKQMDDFILEEEK